MLCFPPQRNPSSFCEAHFTTASSRAEALPDFVATANPDGKLKYMETGIPNVSVRIAQNPRSGLPDAGLPQNRLILHNNACFSTYSHSWLFSVIMTGGCQVLGLLRPLHNPGSTVQVHYVLHSKC